ncbi:MmcQ/YjbR family DNA-binding protein [Xylanimonas ulmi]|uniref:YjbR protein n=1 Tax=Xylanimonas ulmi TaxID=228973 RepID=A0A4Q7M3N0_9MICO|nr:hypothetical protein [Xylanibacterium ulmi]RZS61477.1 hypothetical protein EV386_1779 [Xylanibacterium ulmi]
MASLDDVSRLAARLPGAVEGERSGHRPGVGWSVAGAFFAWVRPLSKADVKRFGDAPVPQGPILACAVEDLADKEAVLAAGRPGLFSIPHFDGYPVVLVSLDAVGEDDLRDALTDAWLTVAPEEQARAYLAGG